MVKAKKIGAILMAAMMIVASMVTGAFAATHDTTEDNSTSTATVTLGKILTAGQANKFPSVTNFNFSIEKVEAWENANTSTAQNGAAIAVADMPAFSDMAPAIGNFTSSATGDTSTVRTRTQAVTATFTKAGHYVYKAKETGSTPANVSGVTYDDHEYFIVVYVANKTDANGNTIDGVYVHDITSYRNESGSATYKPTLTEISTTTDNNNVAASDNTRENLAKVGKSTSEDPDALEAYRFWNDYASQDIEITKNVTGALGDRTKEFEFTVTMTGLEKGQTYTTSGTGALVSASVGSVNTNDKEITADANGNATFLVKIKDDQNFKVEGVPTGATYAISEAASDHVASYAITSSNNAAKFVYESVAVEDMDSEKTYYYENDGTDTEVDQADIQAGTTNVYEKKANQAAAVIAQDSDANAANQTALATAQETVNATDGTITVAYTNDRPISPVTGLSDTMFITLVGAALLALAGGFMVMRRRNYEED
jgi:LPXTG-motif cell wall-anchored protein